MTLTALAGLIGGLGGTAAAGPLDDLLGLTPPPPEVPNYEFEPLPRGDLIVDGFIATSTAAGIERTDEGGNRRALLVPGGYAPRFSPDGRSMVYGRVDAPGLFMANADGTGQRLLVDLGYSPEFKDYDWRPDGSTVMYIRKGDGGSTVEEITPAPGTMRTVFGWSDRSPSSIDLSVDGRWLAVGWFAMNPGGNLTTGLAVLDAHAPDDVGRALEIAPGHPLGSEATWMPDGRLVRWCHESESPSQLCYVALPSGATSPLPITRSGSSTQDPVAHGVAPSPTQRLSAVESNGGLTIIDGEARRDPYSPVGGIHARPGAVEWTRVPLEGICDGHRHTSQDPQGPHANALNCGLDVGLIIDAWPSDELTRGQMATILDRLAAMVGKRLPPGPDAFSDDDGTAHEAALNRLAGAGLYRGVGDRRSAQEGTITRAQLAAFVVRMHGFLGGASPRTEDAFDDDQGTTHEAATNEAAELGIVRGVGPRQFAPGRAVLRGQAVSMAVRLLARHVDHPVAT